MYAIPLRVSLNLVHLNADGLVAGVCICVCVCYTPACQSYSCAS